MTIPELSRRITLDRIGTAPVTARVDATAAERAALAWRFGWLAIERLTADAVLIAGAGGIDAKGTLHATLAQACVVTGDAVRATIAQPFHIRFVAPDAADMATETVDLSPDEIDLMDHDGGAVDLGEAVAQTLALAVDPFPRSAGADTRLKDAGVLGEGETGPFAGLKGLLGR
jgi:uncharacterized metal-binding protein YceD (DUF177 family)